MEVDQPAIADTLKAIVCATDTQVTILSNDQSEGIGQRVHCELKS